MEKFPRGEGDIFHHDISLAGSISEQKMGFGTPLEMENFWGVLSMHFAPRLPMHPCIV